MPNSLPVIASVVFDLDGVLVDSEGVWEEVRRAFVAEGGGRWMPDAQRRLMGMSTGEWARYLSQELGVRMAPDEVAQGVIERMNERYARDLPLIPGAVEAVRRMGGRWPLGVASSSPPAIIHMVLERAGLAEAFGAVASSDEVANGKPAPDVYLLAASRLGVDPTSSVAIEDSSNGLRSASAAGYRVVAIPQSAYPPDPEALALASVRLDSLDALTPEVLEGIE
ncbi:MAG: 2-deoxyglucose-6-phosphate hydrolase YniC [Actinobacteria bacterium]|nr:2-deoxyglucose-6-phosphate hydrolase YniC [Actinomycetota bacterium]